MGKGNYDDVATDLLKATRESVQMVMGALAGGTQSAFEQFCTEAPVLRSLPDEDRPSLLEALSDLAATISARFHPNKKSKLPSRAPRTFSCHGCGPLKSGR